MEYSGTLLTIAELAVALAGFASLVSVIGRRQDATSRALDSRRLRAMLEVALHNAAFALVPLPFLQVAPSNPILWRLASGLQLLTIVAHIVSSLRRARSYEGGWILISTWMLTSISVLTNLANILGLGGSNAFSLYLASLILGLGVAALLFLSVAASVLQAPGS
jgi:hypothetical protein